MHNSLVRQAVLMKTEFAAHQSSVNCLSYSNRDEVLASGGGDNTVRLWKFEDGRSGPPKSLSRLKGHLGYVSSLFFGKENLYSASWDRVIRQWDITKSRTISLYTAHSDCVNCIILYHDTLVSCSWDGTIALTDTRTGITFARLDEHNGGVLSIDISGDDIASCSTDRTVRIFDVKKLGSSKSVFLGHEKSVSCVRFNGNEDGSESEAYISFVPDIPHRDNIIISGDRDGVLRLWDPITLRCVHHLDSHRSSCAAIQMCDNDDEFLTCGYDGTVQKWKVGNDRTFCNISKCEASSVAVFDIVRTKDNIICACKDGKIRIVPENLECEDSSAKFSEETISPGTQITHSRAPILRQKNVPLLRISEIRKEEERSVSSPRVGRSERIKYLDMSCLTPKRRVRSTRSVMTPRTERLLGRRTTYNASKRKSPF